MMIENSESNHDILRCLAFIDQIAKAFHDNEDVLLKYFLVFGVPKEICYGKKINWNATRKREKGEMF